MGVATKGNGVSSVSDKTVVSDHNHDDHYAVVAKTYDSAIYYDLKGPLVQWQLETTMETLDLRPGMRFVDIGGGTGGFTHELAKRLVAAGDASPEVMLVEPSQGMLDQAEARSEPKLQLLLGDALGFCKGAAGFFKGAAADRVMLKEVVHHIPEEDRQESFDKLYESMAPGGKVLIITRPSELVGPFPDFFIKYWAENQPKVETYIEHYKRAGFEVQSGSSVKSFPLRVSKQVWYRMLRDKFWSWLANWEDAEIEAGIQELERAKGGVPGSFVVEGNDFIFQEREVFLVGVKPKGVKPKPARHWLLEKCLFCSG